jgi:hypothetical protein
MTVQFSRKAQTAFSASPPVTRSGLVRRLVRACNDPGKERIRKWLIDIDNAKLQSGLGLIRNDGTPRCLRFGPGWGLSNKTVRSRSFSTDCAGFTSVGCLLFPESDLLTAPPRNDVMGHQRMLRCLGATTQVSQQ